MKSTLPLSALALAISSAYATAHRDEQMISPRVALTVTACDDNGKAGTLRNVIANAAFEEIDIKCDSVMLNSQITIHHGGLTIKGAGQASPGSVKTIIEAKASSLANNRIFVNDYYSPLTLENVQLQGGRSTYAGGCIKSLGPVDLYSSVVIDCKVISDSGDAFGGGIYSLKEVSLYSSTISNSHVSTNTGAAKGGAIYSKTPNAVKIWPNHLSTSNTYLPGTGSTISGSSASSYSGVAIGGAIYAPSATVEVYYSTISSCKSNTVGGISSKNLSLLNSTISGNSGTIRGIGAAYVLQELKIRQSTVAFNTGISPGVYVSEGSTIQAVLGNSILANNNYFGLPGFDLSFGIGAAGIDPRFGSNIIVSTPNQLQLPADTIKTDPRLDVTLKLNGGPTATHALLTGSPALHGSLVGSAHDQRWLPRPQANHQSDVGALQESIFGDGFESPPD